jgi:AcrR family transcriptional regulator
LVARHPSSPRSKFDAILKAATARFGTVGYEHTKWADIAREVGIGQTALYNYFDSKAHCLYALMAITNQDSHDRFVAVLDAAGDDRVATLRSLAEVSFSVDETAQLRRRIVVSEQGRLSVPLGPSRAEDARVLARELIRRTETLWSDFLADGMAAGAFAPTDAGLLGRAVLGLISSVWHWYRPAGPASLTDIAPFFVDRAMSLVLAPRQPNDRR